MDYSNLLDGIILLTCGITIALFGSGKLFPSLRIRESASTMKIVLVVGLLTSFTGIVQLIRYMI
ncbi:hypothetical protein N474_23625 [Pseudoalteromonas luteoviolacea CPMOR-2]|uniref:Uncharacterized protein n=1 Tax=Pseudoalteromonas luteoviolacea DSM 6061 TaxID=1365250 RepID=A0A166WA61_9GAMM|nr:hypothetical protein N475_17195 [Pseudoalteromonas luteoviolacea DSM 6061]KZN51843.1 hypothetical protein N474_23625 [Pseudoalteromonas luteoviolacea CPMOR-2]MBE0390101.1 hypothetical protein [Pseudoalteromonas luteoviolacea DSM 6061]